MNATKTLHPKSSDDEAVDVFIGPHPECEIVFVVAQIDQESGDFDEVKTMLGFLSEGDARKGYLDNYPSGWKCGPITAMTIQQFREWLESGNKQPPVVTKMATEPAQASAGETKSSPWTKYRGPQDGEGWKHRETGEVRYQVDMPTDGGGAAEPVSGAGPEQDSGPTAEHGYSTNPELANYYEPGGTPVDLSRLITSKPSEPKSVQTAIERMTAASQGQMTKRAPVDVLVSDDGSLFVIDGNSTVEASKQMGVATAAVKVHSAKDFLAPFTSAAFLDEEKEDGVPTRASIVSEQDAVYKAADALDQEPDSFQAVLDLGQGLSKDIGGTVISYDEMMSMKSLDKPAILIAKMKGMERAREKVKFKYGGDWSRLTDMVRATVVANPDQFPMVVEHLRRECEQRGWQIEPGSVEDKFAQPTPAGYSDVSLHLRGPNGIVAELQMTSLEMMQAKEHCHDLYEEYRTLDNDPREKSPEELNKMKQLASEMRSYYGRAQATMMRRALGKM